MFFRFPFCLSPSLRSTFFYLSGLTLTDIQTGMGLSTSRPVRKFDKQCSHYLDDTE